MKPAKVIWFALLTVLSVGLITIPRMTAAPSISAAAAQDFSGFAFTLNYGTGHAAPILEITRHNVANGSFTGVLRGTSAVNVTGTITPASRGVSTAQAVPSYRISFTAQTSTYEGAFILNGGSTFIAGTFTTSTLLGGRSITAGPYPFCGNGGLPPG
jgi:hypothetical protein